MEPGAVDEFSPSSGSIPVVARGRRVFARVDPADVEQLSVYGWALNPQTGYVQTRVARRTTYLHRLVLGLTPKDGKYADHINGDKLDNRRANLRVVTASQNCQNRAPCRGSSSRYRGVWLTAWGSWGARLRINGERLYLGMFKTEDEAGAAVRAAVREHMPYATERAVAL